MDVRLFLRIVLCSGLLLGASCGKEDPGPARPSDHEDEDEDEDEDEEGTTGKKDAGKKDAGKKDAGKDAGKKDAGKKDAGSSDDEETEDEEPEDEATEDEEEDPPDAGRGTTAPRDAGKDAATPPSSTKDSGAATVPAPIDEPIPAPGGNGSMPVAACTDLTYEKDIQPIFATKCVGCHSAGTMRENLADQNNISRLRDEIIGRTGGSPIYARMPPGAPLPAADVRKLSDYLSCLP